MGIAEPTILIIIAIVLFVLFGRKRIAEFARGIRAGMDDFQRRL